MDLNLISSGSAKPIRTAGHINPIYKNSSLYISLNGLVLYLLFHYHLFYNKLQYCF